MKILLVLPHGPIHRAKSGTYSKALRYAPLTLIHLASLIPSKLNPEITLIDEGVKIWNPENYLNYDVIAISCMTGTAPRAYSIADYFRKYKIPVILGGIHPTLMPEEAKLHADSVITGLAEQTWPQALLDLQNKKLLPFYHMNPKHSLANLPIARRDLLNKKSYATINSVQASRGCPNKCSFCAIAAAWDHKCYFRPPEEVIAEIHTLKTPEIAFLDPSPMENREYAKKLFSMLTPLKRWWMGCSTIDLAFDKELLNIVSKSGCKGLLIGFESLSETTLADMGKSFNSPKKYLEAMKIFHDKGIAIQACFVFGTDNDTPDVFKKTVDFIYKANIDLPQFSAITPFPGTKFYNDMKKQNRILETNWALFDAEHVVFQPKRMTREQLYQGLLYSWRESYSIRSITKRMINSLCKPQILIPANLGYRFYADKLSIYQKEKMDKEKFFTKES